MPTALSSYLSRRFRSADTRRIRLKRSDNLKRGHFTLESDHETKTALLMSTASSSAKWYRSRRTRNPSEVANFGSSSTLYHSSPNLRSSPFPPRTPIPAHVHTYRRGTALRHMVVTSLRLPRWRKKATLGTRQASACTTRTYAQGPRQKKKSASLAASLSHSRPSPNSHLGKATLIGYPQACGGQMLQRLPCSFCSSSGGCSCTLIDLDQKDGSLKNDEMLGAQLVWAVPRIVVSHPTPSAFEPPRARKDKNDTRRPSRRALAPPRIYPSPNDMPPSPWQTYKLGGSPTDDLVSGRTSAQSIPSHSRSRTHQAHSLASVYSSDLTHNRRTYSSFRNSWLSTSSLLLEEQPIRRDEVSTEGFPDGDRAAAIALENFFRGGGRGGSTYSQYRRSSVDLLLSSIEAGREPFSQVSPPRTSPREKAEVSVSMCRTVPSPEASHFQYELDYEEEEEGIVDRDSRSRSVSSLLSLLPSRDKSQAEDGFQVDLEVMNYTEHQSAGLPCETSRGGKMNKHDDIQVEKQSSPCVNPPFPPESKSTVAHTSEKFLPLPLHASNACKARVAEGEPHDEEVRLEEDQAMHSAAGGGGGGEEEEEEEEEEEGIVGEYRCATEEILREYGVEI